MSNKEQITVKGFRTYLDGTQAPFEMPLDSFQISVGIPITIIDLFSLPMDFDSWTKNSVFTVTKIEL